MSFWEIAIKVKIGKLELPFASFTEFYNFSVLKSKVTVLDLLKEDITKTLELDCIETLLID